jgi:branched-chain amino acid transport system permease protein
MAVGAYAAYNFMVRIEGMPLLAALLLGGVCATVVGVLFGIPVAAHQGPVPGGGHAGGAVLLDWAFLRIKWFTNYSASGSVSVANLNVFGMASTRRTRSTCSAWPSWWCLRSAKNLVRSHIGREWMAIRDMDVAAAVIGIRPVYAKLTAFAVSSFIVGVAGALWGFVHLGSGSRRPFPSTAASSCCS